MGFEFTALLSADSLQYVGLSWAFLALNMVPTTLLVFGRSPLAHVKLRATPAVLCRRPGVTWPGGTW